MAVFQDSIYLFTKNRTTPYTGYTRLYVIPAQPGLHAAGLRDSIFTGIGAVDEYSMTGAAIKSDGSRLILMSNLRMWLLTDVALPYISQATKQEFIFNTATQKEAVAIDNDSVAWFSDEGASGLSGHLYRLTGDSLLTSIDETSPLQPEVWPNPFDKTLTIRTREQARQIVLTDIAGKVKISIKSTALQQTLNTEKLKPGLYMLRVDYAKGSRYVKVVRE
jgi:hypothetical protein